MTNEDKASLIRKMYTEEKRSFADIANELDTYPNKIRRDAINFNIPIRDKSQAQSNALKAGRHKHPTKGKNRPEDIKDKIGFGVLKSWENLDDQQLKKRQTKSLERWNKLDDNTKKNLVKKANDAVRDASKKGSKLEKFLLAKLVESGYKVDFHKEQTLSNTKLQIDLFLPKINTAIEVDGPSHFLPVWGQDTLNKNKKYDNKKQGLILGKGCVLIRIKQTRDFSKARSILIYNQLLQILNTIQQNFPEPDARTFIIEDTNG
jgi:very-short-patch-repair endonuclease